MIEKWNMTSSHPYRSHSRTLKFFQIYLATKVAQNSSNPFAYRDMSPKGIIIKELALVLSVARVLHFSSDGNIPGENSNLGSHVHTVYDLTHVQELRGFWWMRARQEYQNKETMELISKRQSLFCNPKSLSKFIACFHSLLPPNSRIPRSKDIKDHLVEQPTQCLNPYYQLSNPCAGFAPPWSSSILSWTAPIIWSLLRNPRSPSLAPCPWGHLQNRKHGEARPAKGDVNSTGCSVAFVSTSKLQWSASACEQNRNSHLFFLTSSYFNIAVHFF